MKSLMKIIGILLIIVGLAGFTYKYFTYTSNEQVAQIGSVEVTAQKEKAVFISPVLSAVFVVGGLILLFAGRSGRE